MQSTSLARLLIASVLVFLASIAAIGCRGASVPPKRQVKPVPSDVQPATPNGRTTAVSTATVSKSVGTASSDAGVGSAREKAARSQTVTAEEIEALAPEEPDDEELPPAQLLADDELQMGLPASASQAIRNHVELLGRIQRGVARADACEIVSSSDAVLREIDRFLPKTSDSLERCRGGECQDLAEPLHRLGLRLQGLEVTVSGEKVLRSIEFAELSVLFPKNGTAALALLALDAISRPWPMWLEQASESQGCLDVKRPIVPVRVLGKLWAKMPGCLRPFAARSISKMLKESLDTGCFCDITTKTADAYDALITEIEVMPKSIDKRPIPGHRERIHQLRSGKNLGALMCRD